METSHPDHVTLETLVTANRGTIICTAKYGDIYACGNLFPGDNIRGKRFAEEVWPLGIPTYILPRKPTESALAAKPALRENTTKLSRFWSQSSPPQYAPSVQAGAFPTEGATASARTTMPRQHSGRHPRPRR